MHSWMSAQTVFINKITPETSEELLHPCDVFRPISNSQMQIILYKHDEAGILTYSLALVFAVFRGSLVAAKGVGRRLKVSKCLGINAPCDAVARVLVLDVEKLSEDTFTTSLLNPAKLLVPSSDIVCEVVAAEAGKRTASSSSALTRSR